MKTIESELSSVVSNNEKLQRELAALNEELSKCRCELEQMQKTNISQKEQVNRNINKENIIHYSLPTYV